MSNRRYGVAPTRSHRTPRTNTKSICRQGRLRRILLLGGVTVLALAGCGAPTSTDPSIPSATRDTCCAPTTQSDLAANQLSPDEVTLAEHDGLFPPGSSADPYHLNAEQLNFVRYILSVVQTATPTETPGQTTTPDDPSTHLTPDDMLAARTLGVLEGSSGF
jgi:hypothetical protein